MIYPYLSGVKVLRPITLLALVLVSSSLFSQHYKALFLGNSYTASFNLPTTVAQIASSLGDSLTHDRNTPGGYTLEGHSTNANTLNKIRSNDWDYVVLQEQSQRPSFSPGQVANEVFPFAAKLNDSIKANNACTETVFFMTWGRKYGDQNNCPFYTPVCTYSGMQARLRDSYMQMANDNDATVAPCGVAWQRSRLTDSLVNLWSGDNSHPSAHGTYLNACVFYATLWQKPVSGATFYGSIGQQDAIYLQAIADQVVFDSLSQWRIGANKAQAAFTWSANNDTVSFTSTAANATAHSWSFGDGSSDSTANPQHVYPANGDYVVTYIVDSGCDRDTLSDTITVSVLISRPGASEPSALQISPNPVLRGNMLTVQLPALLTGQEKLEILNLEGRSLWKVALSQGQNSLSLNLPDLPQGLYLLRLSGDNSQSVQRFQIID